MPLRRGHAARRAPTRPDPGDRPSLPPPAASRRWRRPRQIARAKKTVLALSTLAAGLSIVALSTSPLEWVVAGDGTPSASHCALLRARDPARPLVAAVTLLPVVALLLCAWCRPRSRLCLVLGLATMLLWVYRFQLRHPGC